MKRSFIRPLGTFPQSPAPVQGLLATPVSSTEIDLTWTAIAGAQNYTVRQNGNPIFTGLTTSFANTGLAPSTAYQYTVAAINQFGEGLKSAPVTATTGVAPTVPAAVTGLIANPVSTSEIDLSWSSALGSTNYIVSRNSVPVSSPVATSFADTGLLQGTLYNYSVAGHNSVGTGPAASASATTQSAATGPTINFAPGHYGEVGNLGFFNGVLDFTQNADVMLGLDTGDKLLGFFVVFGFGQCEGAFGDYSAWFAQVQQLLTYCQAQTPPRRLGIEINISGNVGSASVPSYMLNNATYGQVVSGTGYQGGLFNGPSAGTQAGTVKTVRYDIPATAARIAAAGAALYARFGTDIYAFNATFSEIEDFTVFVPQMTSNAITASFANSGGMFDQLRAGMPKAYLMASFSFINLSNFAALFAATDRNNMSVGCYDFTNEVPVRSGGKSGANRGAVAFRGGQLVSGVFQPVAGLIDRRANVVGGGRDFWGHVGPDELGQRTGGNVVPPADIGDGDIANAIWPQAQLMQCSHMIWYSNRQTGPRCNATSPQNYTPPANYAGGTWGTQVGFIQSVSLPAASYPAAWS